MPSRREPSYLNRRQKNLDPASLLSDSEVTSAKKNQNTRPSAREALPPRRADRPKSREVQFELVLVEESEDPIHPREEELEEVVLRPEDGYWSLDVDEPLELSTVSISARPRWPDDPGQADSEAFAALERQTQAELFGPVSPEGSLEGLYEDVWEDSAADAVLTGTATGETPDRRPDLSFVDDSKSWGTLAPARRRAEDEASDWGGRGVASGTVEPPVVRRPQVRAEEVGLPRPLQPRPRTKGKPVVAGKDVQQTEMLSRARELETELEHYRSENANLKQMRRQQEGLVAELVQQRSELAKWVAEEKAKTVLWCEEQRTAIAKERRAAAKQVKDARLSATALPSRKERAEIESLQATVEKLKVEMEAAAKKARQTERRLQQNLKDQLTAVEEQNQLILALEREKMELVEVLASLGTALPAITNKKLAAEVSKRASLHRMRCGMDSFVEEVPVEVASPGLAREEHSSEVLAIATDLRASLNGCTKNRYATSFGNDGDAIPMSDYQDQVHYETTEFRPENGAFSRPKVSADKEEEVHFDGSRTLQYRNGTIKEISPNGDSFVRFTNGDTKRTVNGEITYYYAEAKTTHTTLRNGSERYEFPNGQVESHFPDGKKEIIFPDGTQKVVHASGLQESKFTDGVVVREHPGGLREVVTTDGRVHHDFGDRVNSV